MEPAFIKMVSDQFSEFGRKLDGIADTVSGNDALLNSHIESVSKYMDDQKDLHKDVVDRLNSAESDLASARTVIKAGVFVLPPLITGIWEATKWLLHSSK